MGLPYMPISWGGLGGQLIGIYGSRMECLGLFLAVGRGRHRRRHVALRAEWH